MIGADIPEASSHRFRDRNTTLQNVDGTDLEQHSDRSSVESCFPHNVTFRTGDWVKDGVFEDREGWDVILA